MRILTNDNNEYFGLATDYKNGNAFRDAIIADGAEGKIAIIAMIHMRPLTDHELSEEGDYHTYEPGHWIPVDVSCETSDVFYHAVETDIPAVEEVVDQVLDNKADEEEEVIVTVGDNLFKEDLLVEPTDAKNDFEFHNNDGTEEEDIHDIEEDELLYR